MNDAVFIVANPRYLERGRSYELCNGGLSARTRDLSFIRIVQIDSVAQMDTSTMDIGGFSSRNKADVE